MTQATVLYAFVPNEKLVRPRPLEILTRAATYIPNGRKSIVTGIPSQIHIYESAEQPKTREALP